jgi:uncharacterized protein YeaO (DUF488 family)
MMDIQTRRVYTPCGKDDGTRVLVDRVWPRGVSRERLQADRWLKEAAPSTGLRKWFGHDPSRWEEFKHRYFSELAAKPDIVHQLCAFAEKGRLTLLFSARDTQHNQAVALKEYLTAKPGQNTIS